MTDNGRVRRSTPIAYEISGLVSEDDWTGPAYSTCTNAASVAARFESSRRRELLTFSHHTEVAHLPPHFADELLAWCEEPLATTGKPRSIRALREEKNRRLAQMAPRTFGSVESEKVAVALTIAPPYEPGSEYALLPLPASPSHEPEVQEQLGEGAPLPAGPIVEFRAFLRYAEARLPADASPAMLLEAVDQTKQLLGRLTKRLRRSGGDDGDEQVVVNLR